MSGRHCPTEGGAEVLDALRRRIRVRGESKRLAHEAGVSTVTISQISRGYRPPSESVARALGFKRVSTWQRIDA